MGRWRGILIPAVLLATVGCDNKLPTGYAPVKLGTMTPTERRGLYAQDFSLEAQAAEDDKNNRNQDTGGVDMNSNHLPGGPQQ